MGKIAKPIDIRRDRRTRITLGSFEARVMDVLWKVPECTVWQVKDKLPSNRAYNTVMTTLVRLFNKGLLTRHKEGHSFVYSARLSPEDWGQLAASEFIANLAAVPNVTHEFVVSSLLHAVSGLDPKLPAKRKARIGSTHSRRARSGTTTR